MSRTQLKWGGAVGVLAFVAAGLAGAGSWAGAGNAVAAPGAVVVPTPPGGPAGRPPPRPARSGTVPTGGLPGGVPRVGPTSTPGAGDAQPAPPRSTPHAPPAEPEHVNLAPGSTLATYTDPTFGFSFRYPSNWHLQAPGAGATVSPGGFSLMLTNYNPIAVKRKATPDEIQSSITIELGIWTDIAKYRSLDEWIADRPRLSPMLEVANVQQITVSGLPARRWVIRGPRVRNEEAIQVGVVQGDRLYLFGAAPTTSRHIAVFDSIVQSFRLPGTP